MLEGVRIQNFKSIRQGYAKLPQFGAIVGRNAAGKTNLIQAVDFVRKLVLGQDTTQVQKKMSLVPEELFHNNQSSQEFTIQIDFSVEEEQFRLIVNISFQNGGPRPKELCVISETLEKRIQSNQTELLYLRDQNSLHGKNNEPVPFAIDRKKLALSLYSDETTKRAREFFEHLTIIQPELEGLRDSATDSTADNLSSLLIRLSHSQAESYQQFQAIIRKMLPAFSSIVEMSAEKKTDSQEEQFLVLLEEKHLKGKLSMQSISSGDLKTLFLIATAVSLKNGSTLLIEEIENATHPKRVKDLVGRLEKASAVKDLQIVFTTHSPTVINSLAPQEVVFTKKDDTKGTEFRLLSEGSEIGKITEFLEKGGDLTEYLESIS